MVSTPIMHSDKDMEILLPQVSDTDVSGHSNAMATAIQSHSLLVSFANTTYQLIPLWLGCAMHPNGCFCAS